MNISTTTSQFVEKIGVRNTIQLLKDAGFDCFDVYLESHVSEIDELFTAEDYVEKAKTIRTWADEIGISCNQTHAAAPTSRGDERTKAFSM